MCWKFSMGVQKDVDIDASWDENGWRQIHSYFNGRISSWVVSIRDGIIIKKKNSVNMVIKTGQFIRQHNLCWMVDVKKKFFFEFNLSHVDIRWCSRTILMSFILFFVANSTWNLFYCFSTKIFTFGVSISTFGHSVRRTLLYGW